MLRIPMFILICFGAIIAQQQSQPPSPGPTKIGQEIKKGSGDKQPNSSDVARKGNAPTPPAPIPGSGTPVTQKEPTNTTNQQQQETLEDRRIVWFTGVLAVVAVFQLLAMLKQSKYMRLSLEATKHAVETTERAYLNPQQWEMDNFGPDKIPRVSLRLYNSGRTPAKVIRCLVNIKIMERLDGESVDRHPAIIEGPFFIAAGSSFRHVIKGTKAITDEQYSRLTDERHSLFVWGIVEYEDIFNKKRSVGFGLRYDVGEGDFMTASRYAHAN